MFHVNMVIPSLYTGDEQAVIGRWMQNEFPYREIQAMSDANKVAEIALSTIQEKLPKGFSIREDGSAVAGRKTWKLSVRMRADLVFPVHIFDIERDDSRPGMSWPEVYYATYLPGYDFWVVTVSIDSDEIFGYSDLALCYFRIDENSGLEASVEKAVTSWWQYLNEEKQKPEWKAMTKPGLIDAVKACQLREDEWNKAGCHDEVVP